MFRALFVTIAVVLCSSAASAQSVDPSGHWIGSVTMPNMEIEFELDLAKGAGGQVTGAITMPGQKVVGLPLSKVESNGLSLIFQARSDQTFTGMLAADGGTITGYYSIQDYTFPFALKRMGAARFEPPARNAAISSDFEGSWNGTLLLNNTRMRVLLKVANRPDGTSTASLTNLDEGSLEIPAVSITATGAQLTLGFKAVEARLVGTLNADRSELTGTLTQGPATMAATFTRNVIAR